MLDEGKDAGPRSTLPGYIDDYEMVLLAYAV